MKFEPVQRAMRSQLTTATPMPDGRPTIVTIQYLRGIAAALVVFHHAMAVPAAAAYYPHPFGEFGVDLFFLISGYIMWVTTAGAQRGPGAFWSARILRIVPIYWIYTTLFIAAALLLPEALFTKPAFDPGFVLKSYLFIPAVHPTAGYVAPIYTLGWTLNYEMFFYLVFGACLFVPTRLRALRGALVALLLFMLVLVGRLADPSGPILATYTNPILLEFLAGIGIAAASRTLQRIPLPVAAALIAAGFAAVGVMSWMAAPPIRLIGYGMPAALIVIGGQAFKHLARASPSRFWLLLGAASYSTYLAHPFAQRIWFVAANKLFTETVAPAAVALYVVGAFAAGILAGILSYLILEKPLITRAHRLFPLRRSTWSFGGNPFGAAKRSVMRPQTLAARRDESQQRVQ